MINSKLFITIGIGFLFVACSNSESGKKTSEHINSDTVTIKKNDAVFRVDQSVAAEVFTKYVINVSGGRPISSSIIKLGDINGDGLTDAVVDYGLEPTSEDNGGGGNAIGEISGLVAFVNSGKELEVADHSDELGANAELQSINNGIIMLEGKEYADDDPRCCPSLKTTIKVVLRNGKLERVK